MSAKGEDSLTQIQKYKALLSVTRRKGGQEMAKKSKKKKTKYTDSNATALKTTDKQAAASSSGLNLTEVTKNTTLQEANDQNNDEASITKAKAMTGQ